MKTNKSDINNFFNALTRQQAIDNGSLIDLSTVAYNVGFNVPVAISSNAWHKIMKKFTRDRQKNDYLKMLLEALFSRVKALSIVLVNPPNMFDFSAPTLDITEKRAIKLKSITGVGDLDTSVITIILAGEDKN